MPADASHGRFAIPALPATLDADQLKVGLVRNLTRYPFCARIPRFGARQERGAALVRMIVETEPVQASPDRREVLFTQVRINPESTSMEGTRFSRTSIALPPHTDASYTEHPHDLVAFQMIRPDPAGGDSIVLPARDLIDALDAATIEALRAPVFPFGKALRPILSGPPGEERIRYYRVQIDEDGAGFPPLPERSRAALATLDAALALETLRLRFRLAPGEILFLNNHRVLHGRTAFGAHSDRLMYRFRAWAGCLTAS